MEIEVQFKGTVCIAGSIDWILVGFKLVECFLCNTDSNIKIRKVILNQRVAFQYEIVIFENASFLSVCINMGGRKKRLW